MTNIGDQLNKYDLDSVPKQSPISTLEKVEKNIVKTKDFTETMKFMSLVNSPKLCLMYLADNSCSEDVTEIEIDKLLDFTKYHHAYLNFNSSSDITKLSLSFNSHLGNSKNDISEQLANGEGILKITDVSERNKIKHKYFYYRKDYEGHINFQEIRAGNKVNLEDGSFLKMPSRFCLKDVHLDIEPNLEFEIASSRIVKNAAEMLIQDTDNEMDIFDILDFLGEERQELASKHLALLESSDDLNQIRNFGEERIEQTITPVQFYENQGQDNVYSEKIFNYVIDLLVNDANNFNSQKDIIATLKQQPGNLSTKQRGLTLETKVKLDRSIIENSQSNLANSSSADVLVAYEITYIEDYQCFDIKMKHTPVPSLCADKLNSILSDIRVNDLEQPESKEKFKADIKEFMYLNAATQFFDRGSGAINHWLLAVLLISKGEDLQDIPELKKGVGLDWEVFSSYKPDFMNSFENFFEGNIFS